MTDDIAIASEHIAHMQAEGLSPYDLINQIGDDLGIPFMNDQYNAYHVAAMAILIARKYKKDV